jgi:hypothetical protein
MAASPVEENEGHDAWFESSRQPSFIVDLSCTPDIIVTTAKIVQPLSGPAVDRDLPVDPRQTCTASPLLDPSRIMVNALMLICSSNSPFQLKLG